MVTFLLWLVWILWVAVCLMAGWSADVAVVPVALWAVLTFGGFDFNKPRGDVKRQLEGKGRSS
jgi:hypothetical protein